MSDLKKLYVCGAFFFMQIIGGFTYPTFGHGDAHLSGASLGDFGGYHGGAIGGHEAHSLVSNDHHGGVSIIGAGGSAHKGITLDLTKGSGGGHAGLFGGSFIAGGHGGGIGGGDAHHIQADHSGLGSYSSGVSSYDVGGDSHGALQAHALAASGHDAAEISPVLYSSYKEGEHNFGLHSAALHAGSGGSGGGFESHHAALTSPSHFGGGGGYHFDHSSGFGH